MNLPVGWLFRCQKNIPYGEFKRRRFGARFYRSQRDGRNHYPEQAESCNLRDNYGALQEKGFAILGVSPDSAAKHSKFKEKYALPFPLVPDTNQDLLKSYGAWGTKQMYGESYEGVIRTTFVIDETGKIEKIFTKVDTKNHTEQILKALGA